MIEKIIVTLLSFILFVYIFLFKMIKKNDTNYLIILGIQAIGIFINFIQILFGVSKTGFFYGIVYIFSIIIPCLVCILEYKKINISEILYVLVSRILLVFGNEKKSKEILIDLCAKYPKSYFAHKLLAQIYEKEGGMRKSIDEYVKVLDIKRNDYKSYYRISILLRDLGRNKQAIEMLENLLKVKPDHMQASAMLVELLIETEEYKKAIGVANKALKFNEDDENLIYNLGIAYIKTNDFSLAKKCFEQIVSINKENYLAYYRLGQIALLYRDFDMAEIYFKNSAYNEKEAKAHYELTKIYMIKNQKDKAINAVQKAIETDINFYEIAQDEPILFPIKQYIKKPEKIVETKKQEEPKVEKMIEEHLNNTYSLTKNLNKQG